MNDLGGRIAELADAREAQDPDERRLRLACLSEANATAKLGLAHNVYATAERYLSWVKGERHEDPNQGLDFLARLEGLTAEFLREERLDPERIKNDIAEYFNRFERQFPGPVSASDQGSFEFPPIPRAVHKDIRA